MSHWDLLRLQDVRRVYRLIGDCRDLGYDPALWHPRLSEGLSRLIGAPMVSVAEGLLEGDSEKQIAERLGLSVTTTHGYVTTLFRHFKVSSRAQLVAYAIKRMSHGQWRRLTTGRNGSL